MAILRPSITSGALALALLFQSTAVSAVGDYRSIDGYGNNLGNPGWGTTNTQLLRKVPNAYSDGISSLARSEAVSPRAISLIIALQEGLIENSKNMTDMVWQWGQFVDHDIDLTDAAGVEDISIPVPYADPYFDPFNTGAQTIPMSRTFFMAGTGTDSSNPREFPNQITAFIDGSNVYGSDTTRAAALRTFSDGKLKTSDGDLLPFNTDGLPNAMSTSPNFFLAGDVRANEQSGLTAMHTLFVREHNYQAERIQNENPSLSDEEIYQEARQIVIAELQAITYNEFLPALIGRNALPRYRGYKANVNPGITIEFSSALYRIGHTMLSSELMRLNENGEVIAAGNLPLRDAFFNPQHVKNEGIDSLLRGLTSKRMQEIDAKGVEDVVNFLFGPPGAGGLDLFAINIQRGREHGLPDFNTLRQAYGLKPYTQFNKISSDPDLQNALTALYNGDINNIDPFIGMLAEEHARGATVGPLIKAGLIDQFTRLRDGDRYWYENILPRTTVNEINRTLLGDIIKRNTNIEVMQRDVFHMDPKKKNTKKDIHVPDNMKDLIEDANLPEAITDLLHDRGILEVTTNETEVPTIVEPALEPEIEEPKMPVSETLLNKIQDANSAQELMESVLNILR